VLTQTSLLGQVGEHLGEVPSTSGSCSQGVVNPHVGALAVVAAGALEPRARIVVVVDAQKMCMVVLSIYASLIVSSAAYANAYDIHLMHIYQLIAKYYVSS
jgi:hypothetical protein